MRYLYNLLYVMLVLLAAPRFIWSALRHGKYRRGWGAKLLGWVPPRMDAGNAVWFHAVSAGEVNLLRPLVTQWQCHHPDWVICISTTTRTGYELAQQRFPTLSVFYSPLDFSWAVAAAMRRIRPALLVLAELELWPNLIAAAGRQNACIAVVNGRMSDRSTRGYRRLRPWVSRVLQSIDLLAVQNEEYASRFIDLGARPDSVHVTGSVKFDGAETDRNNAATRRLVDLAGLAPGDQVFLAGSTQRGEEAAAIAAFRKLRARHASLRLILVPRHPERFQEVAELLDGTGLDWVRRSELPGMCFPASEVLLVDRVGELGAWWGTADVAFVGGSFGSRGGQNMIEPAAYGAAVCFGPNTHNFRAVVHAILGREAAVVVRDTDELTEFVERCLEDPGYRELLGRRAHGLVLENLGATLKTVELLERLPAVAPKKVAMAAA